MGFGVNKKEPKTHKGDYYFETYSDARDFKNKNKEWQDGKVIEYEKGYAVQSGPSGNYAGPETKPKLWKGAKYNKGD